MPASARVEDINGWFEVLRQPVSMAGVYDYLGEKLEGAPDPGKTYRVLRSPEELDDPEFKDSCRLLPWVDEHSGLLGPEELNALPAEEKGIGGVTGERVEFDKKTNTLYINVKCYSEAQRNLIDAGKIELSLGYRCRYIWKAGVWNGEHYDAIQCQLRGNHLATVTEGRMGPLVAVLDSIDIKGNKAMDEELKKMLAAIMLRLDKLDGGDKPEVEVVEDADEAKPDDVKAEDADEAKPDDVKAEDADEAKPDDVKAEDACVEDEGGKGTGMDEADITRRVLQHAGRRDKLAARLKKYTGAFDHSALTESELAKRGCKKLNIAAPAGQELAALTGYLTARESMPAAVARPGTGMDSTDNQTGASWAVQAATKKEA
jgi:hypothetical protein